MSLLPPVDGSASSSERHSVHYWDFIVFRVEGTIFRVPTYAFLDLDEEFLDKSLPFATKSDDPGEERGQVAVLDVNGISKQDFEGLLMIMYPRNGGHHTYEQWLGALRVSTLWGLQDIRLNAITKLTDHQDFKSKTPVEIILLAKEYRVARWLHDAYVALIQCREISMDMLVQDSIPSKSLDLKTTARILQAQLALKVWPGDKTEGPAPAKCNSCIIRNNSAQTGQRPECYAPMYFCPFHANPANIVRTMFQEDFSELSDTPSDPAWDLARAGYRLPLASERDLPGIEKLGEPPCVDNDGSPVFIASALMDHSVLPCKVTTMLHEGKICFTRKGEELAHEGRCDVLPYLPDKMEWVPTSGGQIPVDRMLIEGGYEENGDKLYHALGSLDGVTVPGRTGKHMNGAKFPYGGEKFVSENYRILCWRKKLPE